MQEPPASPRTPSDPGPLSVGPAAIDATPAPRATARPSFVRALFFTLLALLIEGTLLALALGGVPALLAHAPALALIAVWTASNFTLAVLRPVGPQDVARRVADAPLVMLALFVVPLLATPASALGERLGIATGPWAAIPAGAATAIVWCGVALAAIGLAIRISAMRRLGARFSPRIALQRAHALETDGLYARIRHPGYLGAMLATLGGVLAFRSMLAWPLVALMYVAEAARARREEALLEEHFGDAWRAYAKRTGRFLPRLGAR